MTLVLADRVLELSTTTGTGSITLVEDTIGKGHKSRVIGHDKFVSVVIQLKE